jgi:hypothetical protein
MDVGLHWREARNHWWLSRWYGTVNGTNWCGLHMCTRGVLVHKYVAGSRVILHGIHTYDEAKQLCDVMYEMEDGE